MEDNKNHNDENISQNPDSLNDDSIPEEIENSKKKSLLEIAKEIDEKEKQAEIEREHQIQVEHEKQREDYSKQLQKDKIELIKLKQGVIEHSDTIHEVHEEAPVLTIPQKIYNFFYHNMWWLWIAIFLVAIATFLIYDTVTTPKPDMVVLMFTSNQDIYAHTEEMSTYFEQFVDDNNGDDVSTVNIYYIPLDIAENDQLYTSYMAKFSGEMQSANSMVVLADRSCDDMLYPNDILYSLTKDFGDYDNILNYGYYLSDTIFADEIGLENDIPSDIYIAIRRVQQVFDSSTKMQENFDIAFEFMSRLIAYQEDGKEVENIG